jgi:hypothetical protein
LDRLPHREVEVINFLLDDEADAADHVRAFIAIVAFNIKDFPPRTPVGVDAKESLAHRIKIERWRMELGVSCQS